MDAIRKAGALIISEKRLLIVKPHDKPFFISPGGKYEEGESAEACLKRELKEELQINLISCKHYKTYNIDKAAHSNKPLILDLYLVEYSGEIAPSSEIEIVEWLSKENFLKKKFNTSSGFNKFMPDLINDYLI